MTLIVSATDYQIEQALATTPALQPDPATIAATLRHTETMEQSAVYLREQHLDHAGPAWNV